MRWCQAIWVAPRSMSSRRNRCLSSSPLLQVPRLTLTPHLGGAAYEVADIQSEILLAGVRGIYGNPRDWSGLPVRNPEVRERWTARCAACES